VLEAANGAQSYGPDDCLNESRWIAAAALRAAAEQVVPDQQEPVSSPHMGNFITNAHWRQCQAVRTQLLTIATELEAQ
jgi:hypothetical protein